MTSSTHSDDIDNLPEGVYLWPISDDQANRLSDFLSIDFPSLGIKGHFLDGPELTCHTCGKTSGLDDFVGNALKDKIHTREFMVDVLTNHKTRNNTPPHQLECCVCGTTFLESEPVTALGSARSGNNHPQPAIRGWSSRRDWLFSSGINQPQPAMRGWSSRRDWLFSSGSNQA